MRMFVVAVSVAVMFLLSLCVFYIVDTPQASAKDKYAALSDLERQRIVDEVWSRLKVQGYTEQIVGFGYTDEGFEVLFKGKADPDALSIIREVNGDLSLKIYENATCRKL